MKQILSVKNVQKTYGNKEALTYALKKIDFTVSKGEFTAIMGPSGSGKTTLLNILAGIDTPTNGTITINNQGISSLSGEELALFRRKELGFVFQDYNLIDTLTLEENITLPLLLNNAFKSNRVQEVAELLGIANLKHRFPYQTSGGQQQRTAIARAIVHKPALLLADEPSGNLDSKSSTTLLEEFSRLNANQHTTIVMVTHDPHAASYANRIIFLKDGEIAHNLQRINKNRQEFYDEIITMIRKTENIANA